MSRPIQPDLILTVTETVSEGRRALRFEATAADPRHNLYYKIFQGEPLEQTTEAHCRELFRDIARMSGAAAESWFPGRGVELCDEIFPENLRSKLWSLQGAIRTVQIVSNESWIPWELLKLQDPHDSSSAGIFLAEAFSITRWLRGFTPALHLPLSHLAVVVPRDSRLAKSTAEGQRIRNLAGSGRQVVEIPATHQVVREALTTGRHDGWHFAGHGCAVGDSSHGWSLVLEQNERLRTADLFERSRMLEKGSPLVFLNACQSARGATSLTGLGGWASAFLRAGAGAFVGAYWEVEDEPAFCFAEEFYRRMFEGEGIAEAVLLARLKVRATFPHSHDWLAYTVYAHPLASSRSVQAKRSGARRRPPAGPSKPPRRPDPAPLPPELEQPPPSSPELAPGTERINDKDGTILLYIPGGEYFLGGEDVHIWSRPVHRVRLSPFWIAKFPVTNEQYALFLRENPDRSKPAFWEDPTFGRARHPVVGLSWEEAQAYCRWAGLELPSEAQWEAAARGPEGRPYPWGKTPPTSAHANFGGAERGTTPVDAYPAGTGPFGTLDQAGNVWEWCADSWVSDAYLRRPDGAVDPVSQGKGDVRALRGGSWGNPAQDLHAAYRDRGTAKLRFNTQGFRCLWRPQ